MSGIYIPNAQIPQFGHRISVLSDGHAYYEDMANPYVDLGLVTHIPANARVIVACPETFPTPHRKELNDYMRGWNACLRSVMQSALPKEQGGQE